jgi:hypothetical protein
LGHYYPEPWKGDGRSFSVEQQADDLAELVKTLNLERNSPRSCSALIAAAICFSSLALSRSSRRSRATLCKT